MKKFFGLCFLVIAFVLVSCGVNNAASEKASVEFSIPVADILALKNNTSGIARNGGSSSGSSEVYKVLVQLTGENGFYTSRLESVDFSEIYIDEDGKVKGYTQKYYDFLDGLEKLGEKYNFDPEYFFSDGFDMKEEASEEFLADFIQLLKKTGLQKTAAIYETLGDDDLTDEQSEIINNEFETNFTTGENVTFVFDSLKPGNYNIMVDLFVEYTNTYTPIDADGQELEPVTETYISWTYTGDKTTTVFAGIENNEIVPLKFNHNEQALPDIEFTYLDGDEEKTIRPEQNELFHTWETNYETQKYSYWIDITDKDDIKLTIRELMNAVSEGGVTQEGVYQEGVYEESSDYGNPITEPYYIERQYSLKSIKYYINVNSHFETKDISIVPVIEKDTGTYDPYKIEKQEPVEALFKDGYIEFLPVYSSLAATRAQENAKDKSQWLSAKIQILYTKNVSSKILLNEQWLSMLDMRWETSNNQSSDPSTAFTQTEHGSLLENSGGDSGATAEIQTLNFVLHSNSDGTVTESTPPRYIYEASLSSILGEKSLSKGDTVVFTMKVACPENKPLTFNLFYYELQKSDWDRITDDSVLYENNKCIGVGTDRIPEKDGYTFVMPLNFIENPKDYDTVLFFFDGYAGDTETTKSLSVKSLDYYIFPARSKTFVFGLGKNYSGSNPYRYEFEKPLVDDSTGRMFDFEGGETVNVTLRGSVKSYTIENNELLGQNYSSDNDAFVGEIFDNADYHSSINEGWQTYHPLSNTENEDPEHPTVNTLTSSGGYLSNSGKFEFPNIQEPYFDKDEGVTNLPDHIYKFQCTSICNDSSVLLAIENFDIIMEVED